MTADFFHLQDCSGGLRPLASIRSATAEFLRSATADFLPKIPSERPPLQPDQVNGGHRPPLQQNQINGGHRPPPQPQHDFQVSPFSL